MFVVFGNLLTREPNGTFLVGSCKIFWTVILLRGRLLWNDVDYSGLDVIEVLFLY